MENYRPPANRKESDITFFVTAHLKSGLRTFCDPTRAKIVLDTMQFFRSRGEAKVYSYCIMPDHIHAMIRPLRPTTISGLIRRLKTYIAHQIGEGALWEEGFWSETVPTEKSLIQKLNYIHTNPVKAGLSESPEKYAWSSAQEFARGEPLQTIDYLWDSSDSEAARGRRK